MGDANQLIYLKHFIPECKGRILEVGSKDYGSTSSFRDFYKDAAEYVGVDMEAGKGVDIVWDYTKDPEGDASPAVAHGEFDLAICCSVLEHVDVPWVFARALTTEIKIGGKLYMSVPWVWRFHAYPDDYWRFSWRGIEKLFPYFTWEHAMFSTTVPNEIFDAKEGNDNALAMVIQGRKYLPYLCVNMIGTKTRAAFGGYTTQT